MEEVPPYSPTVSPTERRLPREYVPPRETDPRWWQVEDEEDEAALMRPRNPTEPQQRHASTSLSSSQPLSPLHPQSQSQSPRNRAAAKLPPTLTCNPELPPAYSSLDALAHSFRLSAPLVYATKTSQTPRYQVMQEFTRSGRPWRLNIRRLMPRESRANSLSTPISSSSTSTSASTATAPPAPTPHPRIRYDEDGTMYTMTSHEMRGLRSSTLGGIIRLETGSSLLSGKWIKVLHVTKNRRKDSMNAENEARMQRYGYHEDEEWDKRVVFCVRRGRWEDGEGRGVAVEMETQAEEGKGSSREFEILGEVTGPRRDLLVSCWVWKTWVLEGLRWEGDVKGW
ncbi:hypothetical protein BCR34DRAFT_593787 [Clohesyomyces aquaticus]|uniref:Uncharacterized protein n=1 Tax=Clohesyomyces aquaticus TaxID=1231657 RepID=A0A1Y1YF32_9PLEO|nr:hypothetical protein BCR34DRAFT_593787 [Clohesyomyces aquaticus]